MRVTGIERESNAPVGGEIRRLGFMEGQISVPEDFDQIGQDEIQRLFGSV